MTFEEAKSLLQDMRAAKRRANAIKARIADLESDAESIQSALSGNGIPTGNAMTSRVEELALRIETEREKHIAALETYFAIEDKLAAAIDTLDPLEREVILAFYLDGKSLWRIAELTNYSRETVCRKKNVAIRKIADNM